MASFRLVTITQILLFTCYVASPETINYPDLTEELKEWIRDQANQWNPAKKLAKIVRVYNGTEELIKESGRTIHVYDFWFERVGGKTCHGKMTYGTDKGSKIDMSYKFNQCFS